KQTLAQTYPLPSHPPYFPTSLLPDDNPVPMICPRFLVRSSRICAAPTHSCSGCVKKLISLREARFAGISSLGKDPASEPGLSAQGLGECRLGGCYWAPAAGRRSRL